MMMGNKGRYFGGSPLHLCMLLAAAHMKKKTRQKLPSTLYEFELLLVDYSFLMSYKILKLIKLILKCMKEKKRYYTHLKDIS